MGENEVLLEKIAVENRHESQELQVAGADDPCDPQTSGAVPSTSEFRLTCADLEEDQELSAVTVLTLLDQLVKMLDSVQDQQLRMEEWQRGMEGSVKHIQDDMSKLLKSNSGAVNNVDKLLEKNRKISAIMKDVRDKMERQAVQVRKLEENHDYLLHRDNFRVLIFQDQKEIPSSVFMKDPSRNAESESASLDPNRSQEDADLHVVQLSSDEDLNEEEDDEEFMESLEPLEKSRAEKIKRSSLKKVDSLKKAFSRENFEKKMNKIVSVEKREKIKKSLSQKNKSSSFRIFKKIREGEETPEGFMEVHADLAPTQGYDDDSEKEGGADKEKGSVENEEGSVEKEGGAFEKEGWATEEEEVEKEVEVVKEVKVVNEEGELSITEGISAEYALSATLPQGISNLSHNALHIEEEEGQEKEEAGVDESSAAAATVAAAAGGETF